MLWIREPHFENTLILLIFYSYTNIEPSVALDMKLCRYIHFSGEIINQLRLAGALV